MNERYTIIDIETTGALINRDRITEIGIVLMEKGQIVDTFSSLVHPERSIPEFITRITGIDDEMVADAPKFYEIAKDIVEWTEDTYFIAHNVDFDYRFLRAEFEMLGYTFTRKKLCTVKMSRKFFPGLKSYSLGNLIKHFEIPVTSRHRALDDALAAAELFRMIYTQAGSFNDIQKFIRSAEKSTRYPVNVDIEVIEHLPEACGLYYFKDEYGTVLYVGKSINIRKRVRQHFTKNTQKAANLRNRTHAIDYRITGSELVALLDESEEIKLLKPDINRAQRNSSFPYTLIKSADDSGFPFFEIKKLNKSRQGKLKDKILNTYGSLRAAQSHRQEISDAFLLCQCFDEGRKNAHSCVRYQLGYCLGAGVGKEDIVSYKNRFEESIPWVDNYFKEDIIVIEPGPDYSCISLIGIRNGSYYGYVILDKETSFNDFDSLFDQMKPKGANKEVNRILFHYLASHPESKIIKQSRPESQ